MNLLMGNWAILFYYFFFFELVVENYEEQFECGCDLRFCHLLV